MDQVTVHVTLANARELVMARLGHLAPEAVHTCKVKALVDTGTLRSVVPPAVADALDEDVSNLLICYPLCQAKEFRHHGGTR
jgi:hypothetical protein